MGSFALCALATLIAAVLVGFVLGWPKLGISGTSRFLGVLGVVLCGALAVLAVELSRRAVRVRVLFTTIEREQGVFNKRIDILSLRGIRDIRYAQSLWQRMLGIAVLEILPMDGSASTHLAGLPRARELFETLRDRLEVVHKEANSRPAPIQS